MLVFNNAEVIFRFEQEIYTVDEGDGSIEICIKRDGVINRDIFLSVQTVEGSAVVMGEYQLATLTHHIEFSMSGYCK